MKAADAYFNVQLKPHRAMSPTHARNIIIGFTVLFLLASLRMLMIGAWPVAVFFVVDIAALGLAFYINFRRGRVCEDIYLNDTHLTVKRTSPNGLCESWAFEPYWVKVSLETQGRHKPMCLISLHNQRVSVGNFLNEGAVTQLYSNLTAALNRWKHS